MQGTIKIYVPIEYVNQLIESQTEPAEYWTVLPNTWSRADLVEMQIPFNIYEKWAKQKKILLTD